MRYQGFCGPSNPSQSPLADCEKTVNWYLEQIQSPAAPTGAALYPTPGTRLAYQTTDVSGRAILGVAGRCFAVVGGGFWELFADGTKTRHGAVAQDQYPATLSYNGVPGGQQIFITSGSNGYIWDIDGAAFAQVLTGDATQGGMLNGRFLAFDVATGRVRFSDLNDGLTWGAAAIYGFLRSQAPDPWQTMIVMPPEIWLIGAQSFEVWYDSGAYPQPFAPRLGAFGPSGTPAPFSAGVAGDVVTWLERTVSGAGRIVAAKGYVPRPISNYAVETALAEMARTSTLDDCEVLTYTDQGHSFACFSFPTAGQTWVYDFSLGAWHERGTWDAPTHQYTVWGPRVHGYAFGKHLVGDRATGRIYEMGTDLADEAGTPIRRLRIPPPLWASPKQRLCVDRFELMVETGLGLAAGQGSNPQVMLRVSKDARTWGNERTASAGRLGQYGTRVYWTRCGSSDRLWVPEVVTTDPVPWRIVGADLQGTGFSQGGEQ